MYHFKLRGVECSCDTHEELMTVCEDRPKCVMAVAGNGKRATKKRRRKPSYTIVKKKPAACSDLPYVDGPITWEVAHKFAKKLKRDDIAQLRSDLTTRKELPK